MNINHSTVDNSLKVPSDATITGFKQTYNSFISGLKDSSIINLIVNPTMKHVMAASSNNVPFEWNITPVDAVATTSFAQVINGHTAIEFSYLENIDSQSVYQIISQRLKDDTEYTLAFTIQADSDCEISINAPLCGLTDLRNTTTTPTAFVKTYSPTAPTTTYTDYFNFVTPVGLDQIEFHVTNLCTLPTQIPQTPNNIIRVVKLFLFEGSVEFTGGLDISDFLTNVKYDTVWKLTNDGVNYFPILTADSVDGLTVNLDNKVDLSLFYVEHDTVGRHKTYAITDSTYQIGYTLRVIDRNISISDPTVYSVTPTVAHNGGVWDSAYQYSAGDVVTYQNLKWRSMLNNNITHDPEVYSADWWLDIPDGTIYPVTDSFPAYSKAYYVNHAQTLDGFNGLHALVDAAVPANRYGISNSGSAAILTLVVGMGAQDTNAVRIAPAFTVQHDSTGEHVFHISGVDNKLQLVCNHTTGTKTLSFVPYTRNATVLTNNTFTNAFIDSSVTVTHDVNGNHVIKDTDGLLWCMTVANGAFVYTPLFDINAITVQFNLFRQEHDKYGRHVLRDRITGMFYHIYVDTNNTTVRIEPTILEPMSDINQFLALYNTEHDIASEHVFRRHDNTGSFKLTITGVNTYNVSAITPVNEYDPARILMSNGYHTVVQGAVHKFYISNGVICCNP